MFGLAIKTSTDVLHCDLYSCNTSDNHSCQIEGISVVDGAIDCDLKFSRIFWLIDFLTDKLALNFSCQL